MLKAIFAGAGAFIGLFVLGIVFSKLEIGVKWLLLLLSVLAIAVTIDGFRLRGNAKEIPAHLFTGYWKSRLSYMPLIEREEKLYSFTFRYLQSVWVWVVISTVLTILTVLVFLSGRF